MLLRLCAIIFLLIAVFGFGQSVSDYPNISGVWCYDLNKENDFCVYITQKGKHLSADIVIRDKKSGATFVYGKARGYFRTFWDVYLWGRYVKTFNQAAKGDKFMLRWLLYDKAQRIQEVAYWGVYRTTSYLIKE